MTRDNRSRVAVLALIVGLPCGGFVQAASQDKKSNEPQDQTEARNQAEAQDQAHGQAPHGERGEGVPAFWVRPGYRVSIAVKPGKVEQARFMAFGDDGTLYVAQRNPGKVAALRDRDDDGVYETKTTFLTNRRHVHGMQWRDGWLWFSTPTSVGKARDTNDDGSADDVKMVLKDLEAGSGHDWRPLLIVGDHFFTALGDPHNASDQTDGEREKIWRYNLDGSGKTLWCSGIRNTEELHLRPGTDELWGWDHGSDWFGRPIGDHHGMQPVTNLNPPGEFNRYIKNGFYGHPFITANHLPRYEYTDKDNILKLAARTIPPEWTGGPHWAPDGWTFISKDNKAAPKEQIGDAFVAFHGSWNRKPKAGYRIQRVLFDKLTGKPYGSLRIVNTLGGKDNTKTLGRPVDVVEAPDGTLMFTSDAPEQVVYRLEWTGKK